MNGDIDPKTLTDREILILLCERRVSDKERMDRFDNRLGAHGNRLGTLEAWRTFLAGAWAALTGLLYLLYGRH